VLRNHQEEVNQRHWVTSVLAEKVKIWSLDLKYIETETD